MAKGTTYRRPATDAQREAGNAYRRRYAAEHPDRVKQWRLNYAQRLLERAQREEKGGGGGE